MRKHLLLLFVAIMATITAGARNQWPVTLTAADGLPGTRPLFDASLARYICSYRSPLLSFDEPTDKLRITVCETVGTEAATTSYSGRAGRGPGFPYIALSELRVFDADGASISFEMSSNAINNGSKLASLCDSDSMTYFQSTSGRGTFDGNYHYIELTFEKPINDFSVSWSSHPMYTTPIPTLVGLTPGTDYMPCPEQNLTVEKITDIEDLGKEGTLFVLEGHSPEWKYTTYDRTHPGGGFFEAPCLTTSTPSPFGAFSLIPVEGKENTYKVKYVNKERYIAKMSEKGAGEVLWTDVEDNAADISFKQTADGNFELQMMDDSYLIVQNTYMRMATVVKNDDGTTSGSDIPFSQVFTLYKANVSGAAFAPRLRRAIDDARARLAKYSAYFDASDGEGLNGEFARAIAVAEKSLDNSGITYSELCESERLLNNEVCAYTAEYAYLCVDSIAVLCDNMATGELAVSSAPDWQRGTYPEDMEERLQFFITDICEVVDNSSRVSLIDESIDRLQATIKAFWASRIQYIAEFPFMVGTPGDKLPGELQSYGGYAWQSPVYYMNKAASSLRFTVISTDGPTEYLGYDVPSITEFELYDNLGNKIAITEDMITMNSLTTFGGSSLKALVDGKESTFARGAFDASRADVYGYSENPQYFYLDIQLKEPINSFRYVQKGYKLGNENPVKFIFGEYGVRVAPDSVEYAENYAATELEKITDLSQITDDGVYAIFGLDDCDKVNCQAGEGGFYADTKKLSALFNTQCAYTIKSAGDGKYYIRSLSSGAYWGRNETTFAKSNYRSLASKITIAQRTVGNFPGSFAIYEESDDSNFPYLVFEDWEGELGINPLASLEECEFDGQCDWYIYRVNVENPRLLLLDAVLNSAKELDIAVGNDPGCYAGMSPFMATIAEAEAVAAVGNIDAAASVVERLDNAIEASLSVLPNPVVEGVYVLESALDRFEVLAGSKMAIRCAEDEKRPDTYIYRWEATPLNGEAMDSTFCFELISAAESNIVSEWLTFGYIGEEEVKNTYYIKNVGTGFYVAGAESMDMPLGTSEEPEQPFLVSYKGNASFAICDPSVEYRKIYAYNNQNGSNIVGYVVYDVMDDAAARWNLRLLAANTTSINTPVVDGDEVVSVKYYTIGGVASDTPAKGFNIAKYLYRNGAVKSEKIYVK